MTISLTSPDITLNPSIVCRLVAWEKRSGTSGDSIRDVAEIPMRETLRHMSRVFLGYADAYRWTLEVAHPTSKALTMTVVMEKGHIPHGCRKEQPALKVGDIWLSIDRFWALLVESSNEILSRELGQKLDTAFGQTGAK